jgi:hypothetical protein
VVRLGINLKDYPPKQHHEHSDVFRVGYFARTARCWTYARNGPIKIWDATTGADVGTVTNPVPIQVMAVSPDDFKVYNRRGTLVEMEKEIESQVHNLVATRRLTFQTLSASSVKPAAFGFKWL